MLEDVDWVKVILTVASIQAAIILALLWAVFGAVVAYILILLVLVAIIIVLSALLIRSIRIIRATEVGMNRVLNQIVSIGDQFDAEMKKLVWPEDTPQFRKLSSLLFEAKKAMMNAPATFDQTAKSALSGDSEDEAEIQPDDEFIDQLMEKLEEQ